MIESYDEDIDLKNAYFNPALLPRTTFLHGGRYDLPLRAFSAFTYGDTLKVTNILSYKQHVAVLALISVGMHRHQAARTVISNVAGAFCGSIHQFDKWPQRNKLSADVICTTLPDGNNYVVWTRNKKVKTNFIPIVLG